MRFEYRPTFDQVMEALWAFSIEHGVRAHVSCAMIAAPLAPEVNPVETWEPLAQAA